MIHYGILSCLFLLRFEPSEEAAAPFFVFNGLLPLQVDLLKTTALPLMKKFGVDGEKFDLKVRMRLLVNNRGVTFIRHAATL